MLVYNNKKIDIACIHVSGNDVRRDIITRQIQKFDIPLRFFDAITPKTLHLVENDYHPWRTRLWWGRALIPTEQACSLSHLKLWQDFLMSDSDYIVICEDDIEFASDFMMVLRNLIAMDNIADFVKLSGQHERKSKFIAHVTQDKAYNLYRTAFGPLDAGCYLLSKDGAEKLLKYCQKMHMAIDVLMDRTYEHGVPCYTVRPYIADPLEADQVKSQIGDEERHSKYDHNNFFLQLITRLLRLYSSFRKRWAEILLDFS